ncbi:MAG TPA: tripartite tricarboxylate transporter substrate-binding protein [Verrucomicrobiae bacterium]|nr:tripartite tricarboxylate transporter substrate-binding protein [Verrucomicrobiae bacterium]
MTIARRRFLQIAVGALGSSFVYKAAVAETYPSRTVRLLVGFPGGGPVDIAGRTIGAWLSARLGQPCIVENQPGESGNIATRAVVNAAADGYTLLVCGPVNVINAELFDGIDFDFGRDVAAVAGLYRVPLVVEVNPSLPISTVPEFLTYARAKPGRLKVAYAGIGTPQHLGIELFKAMAGVNLSLVPYAGSTPALEALLAGEADAMFDPMPSSIGFINSGRLRPLAVTTSGRSEALPQVPPMSDFVPGYEADSWFGIGAPCGTPSSIIARLNTEINAGLADAEIRSRVAQLGGMVMPGSPAAFAAFLAAETEKYRTIIRAANISVQ